MRTRIFAVSALAFFALGACGSHKENVASTSEIKFDRHVASAVMFRDSLVRDVLLSLDSPEVTVFSPKDSVTVTLRARRAGISAQSRRRVEAESSVSDTLVANVETVKTAVTEHKSGPGFPWLPVGLAVLLAIILTFKTPFSNIDWGTGFKKNRL